MACGGKARAPAEDPGGLQDQGSHFGGDGVRRQRPAAVHAAARRARGARGKGGKRGGRGGETGAPRCPSVLFAVNCLFWGGGHFRRLYLVCWGL